MRRAVRDLELGGNQVEAGEQLLVPLTYLAKHDPRWPKDEEFQPERWLSEEGRQQGPTWFMPFGAGAR